jgi:CheY-like chemotaxis protein
MKILVIDDEPTELKLAHSVLNASGHTVTAIDVAEDAFGSIKADRPEIILLDLGLPGMDGLALVRALKADPHTRDIRVVAITSFPERFSQYDAMEAGCDAYLRKPVNTRTLPQHLSDVFARGGGTR